MELFDINQLALFMLVLARISAFFAVGPLFSMANIPGLVKVGLSFLVAIIVFPLVDPKPGIDITNGWYYIFALFRETLVGLAMGYIAGLVLNALVFAGSLIDIHIGYFMSIIFDPVSGSMAGIMSRFMHLLGLAVLLSFNGHHMIIAALVGSFDVVPVNVAQAGGATALFFIKAFAQMINTGVQIAAPLIAVMLVIDVTLGLLARTAPQINVFMLGFPIKIIFGMITLSVMVPALVRIIYSLCGVIERDILTLLKGMT
ncbi:flagellar type III secretion system protein FliR [Desulfallas sp. Bu1-1]|uniref:flagellar biosynthetic protein FliR n=1 Tax=Desulfallas sp. Bu1-1 TaxID=2787620 RepID=UPI00189FD759|nr:flagellar biosynthetic protein FliR [Desulfallas sp. Bu1-1]MBF7081950.1 flagellar type III secretion system protein FliR [Desulfallas sp. Bu1-1]